MEREEEGGGGVLPSAMMTGRLHGAASTASSSACPCGCRKCVCVCCEKGSRRVENRVKSILMQAHWPINNLYDDD